jgi:hypothetical protein
MVTQLRDEVTKQATYASALAQARAVIRSGEACRIGWCLFLLDSGTLSSRSTQFHNFLYPNIFTLTPRLFINQYNGQLGKSLFSTTSGLQLTSSKSSGMILP